MTLCVVPCTRLGMQGDRVTDSKMAQYAVAIVPYELGKFVPMDFEVRNRAHKGPILLIFV